MSYRETCQPEDAVIKETLIQGDLAEIIVYARVLTDEERMRAEDYLAQKYGLTLAR